MAAIMDFQSPRYADGTLTINLAPPTDIGGFTIQTTFMKRFGGVSGIAIRSMASGFYGVSGMNIQNSGQGIMTVQINSTDFSGFNYGNYSFGVERLDSGSRTILLEGYCTLLPGPG